MSVAVCRSLKPTLRQNFSMYTNSWNSGNHFLAFWMMDFRNDTSSWCAVSLSAISLRCLTCNSISWRLCSSCCRCICCCNNLMLSSRAATSPCRVALQGAVVGFQLFQFTTAQKRTDLCHECGFRFRLGSFQFLRLDFLPYLVKLLFCLLLLGL